MKQALLMALLNRAATSIFTAAPSAVFFVAAITSEGMRQEYYWTTILTGVSVMLGCSVLFGFVLPPRLYPKWLWITIAGVAVMILALSTVAILNATPLCVGQDNGDGINDFGMCMGYVLVYAVVYGIPYLALVTASALVGHLALNACTKYEA
jgi:hypothetical protein